MLTEENLKKFKNLRLIDDIFFSVFFDNNPKDLEYVLRIILDKSNLKVLEIQPQKTLENLFGRSVRFDVFATDDEGKLYNIEVQRADAGALPNRARYNSSMLDYHIARKSEKFTSLPETFVIFITEHDVLKGDEPIYHIERVIKETNKHFNDGTHIIYVNGSCKGSGSALLDLIHDFFCVNPADMRHKQLAERAKFLKENEMGLENMGNYSDELINEGRIEGIKEGRIEGRIEGEKNKLLENIRSLMETMKFTAKQAMDALKVPADKQEELRNLI